MMKQTITILSLLIAVICGLYLVAREVRQSQTLLPALQIQAQADMQTKAIDREIISDLIGLIDRNQTRPGQDSGLYLLIGLILGGFIALVYALVSEKKQRPEAQIFVVNSEIYKELSRQQFKTLPYIQEVNQWTE